MQAAEDGCFRILERELGSLGFSGARLERRPVNPAIQAHPNYSLLHFTKTPQRPQGLSPEETYAGRSNLLYVVPGAGGSSAGQSVALNAHIDVVAPYFPPRVKGGIVLWPRRVRRQRPGGQHRRRAEGALRSHARGRAEVEPERGGHAGGRGGNRRQRLPLARH